MVTRFPAPILRSSCSPCSYKPRVDGDEVLFISDGDFKTRCLYPRDVVDVRVLEGVDFGVIYCCVVILS